MKYIYMLFVNRTLGGKHWFIDKCFISKKSAEKYAKKVMRKFPKGAYNIERERLYE